MPAVPRSLRESPGRLGAGVALVAGWCGAAALLLTDVGAGRPVFLAAGLLPAMAAVTVLAAGPLGLPVPDWSDHEPDRRYRLGSAAEACVAVVVRASAWPLFAVQAAGGRLGFPAWGDLALLAQTVLLVVAVLATAPWRSVVRTLRLGFDALLSAFGLTLALWVLVVGPDVGFLLGGKVLLALGLCFGLFLQLALVTLVIVREPVTHGGTAVVATAAVVAAEVGVVVSTFAGGRALPASLAVCWVAGWLVMTGSILFNRSVPVELLSAEEAERREVRSTDLATGAVVLAVVACVLGYQTAPGAPRLPAGWVGAGVALAAITVFAGRESLLGRLRARLTSQLRHQAHLDPLTGLANRRGLTERLRRIPQDAEWSVLALDLDGFKAVNDVHGHAAGDEVLVVVADVLRGLGPADGLAARTGGDEFTVLTPGDVTAARELGLRITAAVRDRLAVLGLGPRITVSVGVGRVGADGRRGPGVPGAAGRDRLAAVVEAAAALRAAKDLGRDRVQVYPGLVARQRERRLLVEARLREALREGRVVAVGQPIVDLSTGATVAVEALARWQDEVLGHVPPAEFVLVAERGGLVADVGRAVLRSAVTQYVQHGLVGSGVRLAVNVSPLELRGPAFVDGVTAVLAAAGLPARDLVVEVTEAVVIEPGDPSVRVLSRLGDLGVQIAIDDFGTGYSALGYLRRLPVQSMKVDRSLVAEAMTSVRTRQIVTGVVDLARRLGLVVTLEGIEDAATARLAHDLGAHHGQGFALGRPVPWPELAERLRGEARAGRQAASR